MSAAPLPRHLAWLWTPAVFALAVDQASKYLIFHWLQLRESVPIIPNLLFFTHNHLNQGALFGLGNDHGELSNYSFAAFSAAAVVFIVWWSRRPEVAHDRLLLTALGLILGGAAGNLYDRLVFGGVRDFIWVHHEAATWNFDFAVFNFADSCLVVGACLLFLHTLLLPGRKEEPTPAPAVTEGPAVP